MSGNVMWELNMRAVRRDCDIRHERRCGCFQFRSRTRIQRLRGGIFRMTLPMEPNRWTRAYCSHHYGSRLAAYYSRRYEVPIDRDLARGWIRAGRRRRTAVVEPSRAGA